ncbi:hypothetical protein B0H11DRAFT_2005956 [Mycena galericulata]|nr:hypothetical protein B0H11DRAFT_2005956 [Mycena galericulata]
MPRFISSRVAGGSFLRTTSYHPHSMLRRRFIVSRNCTWLFLWCFLLFVGSLPGTRAQGSFNVSVSNTAPEIVYTPFLCNGDIPSNDPDCKGAWNATDIGGIATVTTDGPDAEGANIVPQMFMSFRASALYMSTSTISNATANFTVTSGTTSISRLVDSSAGFVAVVNLVESALTTLTITFIPGDDDNSTHLDIGSILLTVTDSTETDSFLPTMSLPPSMSLPTFLPESTTASSSASASPSSSTTTTPTQSLAHRAQIAEALGIVLGLGIGLSLIAGTLFWWWRRRRRARAAEKTWF